MKRTDITLTLKVNNTSKVVVATIHHDFGYEYKEILGENGNSLFVDYGLRIDGIVIPSNSKLIADGLVVSAVFDFSNELVEVVKDRAWRWYKTIRQRVRTAIYEGMRNRYDILSGTSNTESESSGSGSLISGYYTDSSTFSTESSPDSDSTYILDEISPSNLVYNYSAKSGLLVATLTHDLAYTDRKLLNMYPNRSRIIYGPSESFGFKIPAQSHVVTDGLVVEIHLRYNAKNYNNCVSAAHAWFDHCSVELRHFLNILRS